MKNLIYSTASTIATLPKFTTAILNDTQESLAMGQLLDLRDAITGISENMPEYGTPEYSTAKKVLAWYNNTVYTVNNCNSANPDRFQYAERIE